MTDLDVNKKADGTYDVSVWDPDEQVALRFNLTENEVQELREALFDE